MTQVDVYVRGGGRRVDKIRVVIRTHQIINLDVNMSGLEGTSPNFVWRAIENFGGAAGAAQTIKGYPR